jgi:hypothetical protein
MTAYRRLPNGSLVPMNAATQPYGTSPYSADAMMQRGHGLGAADPGLPPQSHPVYMGPGIENDPRWDQFEKIPSWYVVSVLLAGASGSVAGASTPLRPEPFIAKRITYACTGDVAPNVTATAINQSFGSIQGRAVTITWQDEFTNFMGTRPVLLSALFGDSQGFLDLQRGLLFQGKQSLSVNLTRLFYPDPGAEDPETRFDFCFHGISMLPKGVFQSGSAG